MTEIPGKMANRLLGASASGANTLGTKMGLSLETLIFTVSEKRHWFWSETVAMTVSFWIAERQTFEQSVVIQGSTGSQLISLKSWSEGMERQTVSPEKIN